MIDELGSKDELVLETFNKQIKYLTCNPLLKSLFDKTDIKEELYEEFKNGGTNNTFFVFMLSRYKEINNDDEKRNNLSREVNRIDILKEFIAQGGLTDNLHQEAEKYFSNGQRYELIYRTVLLQDMSLPIMHKLYRIDRLHEYVKLSNGDEIEMTAKLIIQSLKYLKLSHQLLLIDYILNENVEEDLDHFIRLSSGEGITPSRTKFEIHVYSKWEKVKGIYYPLLCEYKKKVLDPNKLLNESLKEGGNTQKTKGFYDYFICDELEKNALKLFISEEIEDYIGMDIAVLVSALQEEFILNLTGTQKDFWDALRREFKISFSDSGLNEHMRKIRHEKTLEEKSKMLNFYYKNKIEVMRKQIRQVIDNVK